MPHYHLPQAELSAEHKRHAVLDLHLEVNLPPQPNAASAADAPPRLLQVWGSFSLVCEPSNCPLRRGQIVQLKLSSPDGRWTKADAVLTHLRDLQPMTTGMRDYRWEFLIPLKPEHDPSGWFRREGEPPPPPRARQEGPPLNQPLAGPMAKLPLRPIQELDPNAREVALADLLMELGGVADAPPIRFTREGGFHQTNHP